MEHTCNRKRFEKEIVIMFLLLDCGMSAANNIIGTWFYSGTYLQISDSLWTCYETDDCGLVRRMYSEPYFLRDDSIIDGPNLNSISGLYEYYDACIHVSNDTFVINKQWCSFTFLRHSLPDKVYAFDDEEYESIHAYSETSRFDSIYSFTIAQILHPSIKAELAELVSHIPPMSYPPEVHFFMVEDSCKITVTNNVGWPFCSDSQLQLIQVEGRYLVVGTVPQCDWFRKTSGMQNYEVCYTQQIGCDHIRHISICDDYMNTSHSILLSVVVPLKL